MCKRILKFIVSLILDNRIETFIIDTVQFHKPLLTILAILFVTGAFAAAFL